VEKLAAPVGAPQNFENAPKKLLPSEIGSHIGAGVCGKQFPQVLRHQRLRKKSFLLQSPMLLRVKSQRMDGERSPHTNGVMVER
jgi:hypothetical protein